MDIQIVVVGWDLGTRDMPRRPPGHEAITPQVQRIVDAAREAAARCAVKETVIIRCRGRARAEAIEAALTNEDARIDVIDDEGHVIGRPGVEIRPEPQ